MSEQKLADVERRIKGFELNEDTLDDMASRVDEAEAKLKSSA